MRISDWSSDVCSSDLSAARIAGSAGTGKTIVALHRAVFLARSQPDSRILLTTFSVTLAHALTTKLRPLISTAPRLGERLAVHALAAIGARLFESHLGALRPADQATLTRYLQDAIATQAARTFTIYRKRPL